MKDGKPESLAEALLLLEKMNARLSEKDRVRKYNPSDGNHLLYKLLFQYLEIALILAMLKAV